MDSSPVLRQQSQNTIRPDILRTKSEQNKIVDSKSSKVLSLHPLQHNLENQDPVGSRQVRPPHVRPGVSRLPVSAKSLHLQTHNEFTQSHSKWEEKPLAGKSKTKKPCTRPVPFNLSQPKSKRVASENQHPNAFHPTRTSKLYNNDCSSQTKPTSKNSKHSGTLHENVKSIKSSENASQPLGQPKHSHKISATISKPMPCSSNSAAAEKPSAAEICSKNLNLLSLKDASSNTKSKFTANTLVDNFQHDHAALLSILRNEGVAPTMTTQSKPCNYLPQRVSVMKSRQKAETNAGSIKSVAFSPDHGALQSILKNEKVKVDRAPSIYTPMRVTVKKKDAETGTGLKGSSVKTVSFSPDAAALQSILQNEGVKTIGPVGVTPRNSVCPAGRTTSVYTAQRVPVKTNSAEPSPGPVVAARIQTPVQKWTPQRVSRHQPMSAVKWHTSQLSPYAITPSFRSGKPNLCPKQEEVVQKLFDEEDDVNIEVTMPQTELPPDQNTCAVEMQKSKANENGKEGLLKEEEQVMGQFHAPERESVIFFSTGKKLFRDPRFKKPEVTDEKEHTLEDTLHVLQQSRQSCATVYTVPKDLQTQTDVIHSAVAMLRKRLPLLEELRLDEEVATYTSVSVPTVSGFHPPRSRCGNPVATILHFEESTRFEPIRSDTSLVTQLW